MAKRQRTQPGTGTGRNPRGRFERTIDNVERDAHAARLRAANMSWRQIADVLDYTDESSARRAAQRALDAVPVDAAEQLRAVENVRLDYLLEKLAPGIDAGDVPAIEAARKISESRRRLYGLDGPIQVNLTETTQADLAMQDIVNEAKAKAAAERAKATGEHAH